MKIKFIGAAQTVTGSQHLISVNGKKILLDCGLFQGKRKEAFEINRNFPFDPSTIDAMLLSHAHLDHSGNIPHLVKSGFKGHIYSTAATVALCQLMLRDSAFLQEKDVVFVNKKRIRQNKNPFESLYTIDDVEKAMTSFIGVQYDRKFEIFPGISATFIDAGHILGSAGILLEIIENGKTTRLGFSGDIGRPEMPILRDPVPIPNADVLIMESTYGDRLHPINDHVEQETVSVINEVIKRGGKIIIPSFAVGRTQLLVYELHQLFDQNKLPIFPIFVDSPLAVNVTEVYRLHPECFDRETYSDFINNHEDPFGFSRLTYTRDVNESKKLNTFKGPCMIISASGMAEGGRILHHLANNIENPNNMILFAGYAAKETLARKIMDGAENVNILGSPYQVKAQIKKMDYFSAHADQNGLLNYVDVAVPDKHKNIFIVHGEPEESLPLKEKMSGKGYTNVHYPKTGEEFEI
ncbi:MAG: MBL fold metallo-hydrolase [Ignavibacteriaceae bacterium]|nr:MBL fold metallo-hydrolase [Ignavibacteriaceae bacterium]